MKRTTRLLIEAFHSLNCLPASERPIATEMWRVYTQEDDRAISRALVVALHHPDGAVREEAIRCVLDSISESLDD